MSYTFRHVLTPTSTILEGVLLDENENRLFHPLFPYSTNLLLEVGRLLTRQRENDDPTSGNLYVWISDPK